MGYIDIHTHRNNSDPNVKSIVNFIVPNSSSELEEFENSDFPANCSIGIHPWYSNDYIIKSQLPILRSILKRQSVFAIGECGLDRIKGPDLSFQEEIFIKQIRLAEEFKKPLIIHSVRCSSELLSIKKIIRPKIPMIIHGFNGSLQIANSLIDKGYFLSFGKHLMSENSKLEEVFQAIDLSRCFLETDDNEYQIAEIYEKAAKISKIEVDELKKSLLTNFIELSIYE